LAYTVAPNLWALALIIPLVPIGTALLFPSTTALMSRASPKDELGTTMGVAQTFAGVARVVAPILGTAAFQRVGHSAPFFFAAGTVGLVGLMSLKVQPISMHTTETPVPAPLPGTAGAAVAAGASPQVAADAALAEEAASKTKGQS